MPKKWFLPIFIVLLLFGVAAFVVGATFLAVNPKKAQTRLAFTLDSSVPSYNFSEAISAESKIVETLAETADFKDIRDLSFQGGFSTMSQVFPGNKEKTLAEWNKRIKVSRIKDSLAIKVEAIGNNDEQSMELSGIVAHVLALSGGKMYGEKIVHFRLDEPVLVSLVPNFVTGIILATGILLLVVSTTTLIFYITKYFGMRNKVAYDFSKFKKDMVISAASLKTEPEDPRHLLQKFLNENRKK